MKRMLDVLWPKIESQFKSWSSCIADGGNAVVGEHLSEITVMMRAKFRNYLLAVVEKFVENVSIYCNLSTSFISFDVDFFFFKYCQNMLNKLPFQNGSQVISLFRIPQS